MDTCIDKLVEEIYIYRPIIFTGSDNQLISEIKTTSQGIK